MNEPCSWGNIKNDINTTGIIEKPIPGCREDHYIYF